MVAPPKGVVLPPRGPDHFHHELLRRDGVVWAEVLRGARGDGCDVYFPDPSGIEEVELGPGSSVRMRETWVLRIFSGRHARRAKGKGREEAPAWVVEARHRSDRDATQLALPDPRAIAPRSFALRSESGVLVGTVALDAEQRGIVISDAEGLTRIALRLSGGDPLDTASARAVFRVEEQGRPALLGVLRDGSAPVGRDYETMMP